MAGLCLLALVTVTSYSWLGGGGVAADSQEACTDIERVYHGHDDLGKYLFVVALLLMNLRTCSGTLITPSWVLTAAHCNVVNSVQYGNMTVSPKDIQCTSKMIKRVPHQSFKKILTANDLHCDVALILVERIPLREYGKLSAVDYRSLNGLKVEYAGFGGTSRAILDYPGKRSGNGRVLGNEKSSRFGVIMNNRGQRLLWIYDDENKSRFPWILDEVPRSRLSKILEDLMRPLQLASGVVVSCTAMYNEYTPCICVAPRCGDQQSVLPGDSGGPLFYDGKIVGIAHTLLERQHISLFMPISPLLDWIHQVMVSEEQNMREQV